ncbi:MAG: S-methyl-5-thioribose-1-phosphate isomerase [Candidatus Omnitrophica bacterium]|nr:S-methyl-5-thioribose-1-phosphate isomerase [Candidatus Omnitrophota bacterium]
MLVNGKAYRTVWMEQGAVKLIDQHQLPHRFEVATLVGFRDTAEAIKTMLVRGAGAIGAAAGYAMAQAVLEAPASGFADFVKGAAEHIRSTRPTAHDLFFAVDQVLDASLKASTPEAAREAAVKTATVLADENARAGERIGEHGVRLLKSGTRILTHCNAGWLAFVDWGSALAPVYMAQRQGVEVFVYVTETRPRSQGAKLTAWELGQAGIPHAIIADTAAGFFFQQRMIDCVIVGADRIAANGDVANKIGTFTLAVLARHHGVPFYVAAPRSTFDLRTPDGAAIRIEERSEDEVLWVSGRSRQGALEQVRIAPEGSPARNPAFDRTPASLVTRFITDGGVFEPSPQAIARFVRGAAPAAIS